MKVYIMDGMAFVEYEKGFMLCIGTKEEVDNASEKQLIRLIEVAIALAQFQSIQPSRWNIRH